MLADNKESIAISVISCCWNVEPYIRKCVDSILAQSFKDFELILVDDGSPDNCPQIIDEYANKYTNIIAIHKENGGLSDARNYGLKAASGKYTIFIDPDDWVESFFLEELYECASTNDSDVVICDFIKEDEKRMIHAKQQPRELNSASILSQIVVGELEGYTWNKLIKRSIYTKYGIEYVKGMYGCEDMYTMCEIFKNDLSISYTPKASYHYIIRQNSLTRKYDRQVYLMDIDIRERLNSLLKNTQVAKIADDEFTAYIVKRAFLYGNKVFSSSEFKKLFGRGFKVPLDGGKVENFFIRMAIKTNYKIAYFCYMIYFKLKQILKSIIYR